MRTKMPDLNDIIRDYVDAKKTYQEKCKSIAEDLVKKCVESTPELNDPLIFLVKKTSITS